MHIQCMEEFVQHPHSSKMFHSLSHVTRYPQSLRETYVQAVFVHVIVILLSVITKVTMEVAAFCKFYDDHQLTLSAKNKHIREIMIYSAISRSPKVFVRLYPAKTKVFPAAPRLR